MSEVAATPPEEVQVPDAAQAVQDAMDLYQGAMTKVASLEEQVKEHDALKAKVTELEQERDAARAKSASAASPGISDDEKSAVEVAASTLIQAGYLSQIDKSAFVQSIEENGLSGSLDRLCEFAQIGLAQPKGELVPANTSALSKQASDNTFWKKSLGRV